MPFRDRIEVTFDAGHRLLGYNGKCASPHGHTFRVELLVEGEELDGLGLLVDFGDLKSTVKGFVDSRWDHGFLLNSDDTVLLDSLQRVPEAKLYVLPGVNPSAEAMARELFAVAAERFGEAVFSVRVWESTTQYGEYGKRGWP